MSMAAGTHSCAFPVRIGDTLPRITRSCDKVYAAERGMCLNGHDLEAGRPQGFGNLERPTSLGRHFEIDLFAEDRVLARLVVAAHRVHAWQRDGHIGSMPLINVT